MDAIRMIEQTKHLRRLALCLSVLGAGPLGVIGCAERPARVEEALSAKMLARDAAHNAFAYAVGDDSAAPADPETRAMLLEMREAFQTNSLKVHGHIKGNVLGLEASIYEVYGSSPNHPDASELIDAIAARLSTTTPLAGDFFAARRGKIEVDGALHTMRGIDPSVPTLTQDPLSPSTCLASFPPCEPNAGYPTMMVWRWPNTYLTCQPNMKNGDLCTPFAQKAGEEIHCRIWSSVPGGGGSCRCMCF